MRQYTLAVSSLKFCELLIDSSNVTNRHVSQSSLWHHSQACPHSLERGEKVLADTHAANREEA